MHLPGLHFDRQDRPHGLMEYARDRLSTAIVEASQVAE